MTKRLRAPSPAPGEKCSSFGNVVVHRSRRGEPLAWRSSLSTLRNPFGAVRRACGRRCCFDDVEDLLRLRSRAADALAEICLGLAPSPKHPLSTGQFFVDDRPAGTMPPSQRTRPATLAKDFSSRSDFGAARLRLRDCALKTFLLLRGSAPEMKHQTSTSGRLSPGWTSDALSIRSCEPDAGQLRA